LFIFNANLVERFAKQIPVNTFGHIVDKEKAGLFFYGSVALGYTDMSVYEPSNE